MLYQLRTWGVTLIGVLIAGMLIGSRLADTSFLWWLIIALGFLSFGGGICLYALEKIRSTERKSVDDL